MGLMRIGVLAYVQGFTTATNVWVSGKRDHFKGMTASEVLDKSQVCVQRKQTRYFGGNADPHG
ncbi:MAG: hypothetical protein CL562_00695 [Alphaproteobacteria bacterium]|nr:hypothetical protein [Alphaproteobacteria bacterium]